MHIASLTSFQYTITDLQRSHFQYLLSRLGTLYSRYERGIPKPNNEKPYKPFPPPSTDTGLLHAANTDHIIYM